MSRFVVGLVSDTHGLVRPQALAALAGCDHLVHAGDIGKRNGDEAGVLAAFGALAPLTVVRGNNDRAAWAAAIPWTATLALGGARLHALHIVGELALDPVAEKVDVVVSGHSHKPLIVTRNGVLYVNPGSAGPRRFKLPVTVARLEIEAGRIEARLIELQIE